MLIVRNYNLLHSRQLVVYSSKRRPEAIHDKVDGGWGITLSLLPTKGHTKNLDASKVHQKFMQQIWCHGSDVSPFSDKLWLQLLQLWRNALYIYPEHAPIPSGTQFSRIFIHWKLAPIEEVWHGGRNRVQNFSGTVGTVVPTAIKMVSCNVLYKGWGCMCSYSHNFQLPPLCPW